MKPCRLVALADGLLACGSGPKADLVLANVTAFWADSNFFVVDPRVSYIMVAGKLPSIEVGKTADLVVLGSDPSVDIQRLTDVAYVIKGGRMRKP